MNDGAGPLVEARNVKKYFTLSAGLVARSLFRQRDRVVKAVDGVNLKIHPSEVVGMVGESGCGKTTLGRMMAHLQDPTEGELLFEGRAVRDGRVSGDDSHAASRYSDVAQIIFQNPYSSLNPRKTVSQIIGVALRQQGITDPVELMDSVVQLMRRVGLSESQVDSYPHQFSGGQRQRIGIARALAANPRFIVADEPVSALDVSVMAQVMNLLMDLRDERDLTYLFISHDLSAVEYVSDRVVVMYLGHLVEEAPAQELFEDPWHPYTRALLAAVPMVDVARRRSRIVLQGTVPSPIDPPPGCPFKTRCYEAKVPACETEMPPAVEVSRGHTAACWLIDKSGIVASAWGA